MSATTAQFTAILSHAGKNHRLCTLLLEPYLDMSHKRTLFDELHAHTVCTCRYVGVWEIADGRLLLNRLHTLEGEDLPFDVLFPRRQAPIFAGWFSGTLRRPQGEMFKYVHDGFQRIYERNWRIDVKDGLAQGARVEITSPLPPP